MKLKNIIWNCVAAFGLAFLILGGGCTNGESPKGKQKPGKEPSKQVKAKSEVLGMIPKDSAMCLCINNPDATITALDKYLEGISPQPGMVREGMLPQMGAMLDNPELNRKREWMA